MNIVDPFDSQAASSDIVDPFDTEPAEPVKPEKSGFIRRAFGDTGVSALKSAIGVPELAVGLADIATGGRAGKLAEQAGFRPKEAKNIISDYYSPEYKANLQKFQNADGFVDKTLTAIQNPSLIVNPVVESLGAMGAGGVIGRGVMAIAPKLTGVAASAIGEGVAGAGMSAEGTRQETDDGLLTGKQAALAAATGFGTGLITLGAGRVANKLGIDDVDTAIVNGMRQDVTKSAPRRMIEGAFTEGVLEELPQSLQEQALQNIALDKPVTEGLDDAAALGLLSGGVMGAGINALPRPRISAINDDGTTTELNPAGGVLERAAIAGIESGAARGIVNNQSLADDELLNAIESQNVRDNPVTDLATANAGLGGNNASGSGADTLLLDAGIPQQSAIPSDTQEPLPSDGTNPLVRTADGRVGEALTTVDLAAQEAATSELNDLAQPTDAQKEAGNYKVGRVKVGGLDISIENPLGSVRKGIAEDGQPFENVLQDNYGYFKGVKARSPDKEHVDTFIKKGTAEDFAGDVFVVNQNNQQTGAFDEPKVLLGYANAEEAKAGYLSNYNADFKGFGSITQLPFADFKERLNDEKAFLQPVINATTLNDAPALLDTSALPIDIAQLSAGANLGDLGANTVSDNSEIAPSLPPVIDGVEKRTYLDVPFTSVKFAKERGAKWDAEKKLWYATPLTEGAQKGQIADGLSIPLYNPQQDLAAYSKNAAKVVAINKTSATGIEHISEQSTAHPAEWIVKPANPNTQTDLESKENLNAVSQESKRTTKAATANPLFEKNRDKIESLAPRMNWATIGNKRIDDAQGNQIGRTKYEPIDDAMDAIRKQGTLSYNAMRNAVDKALTGKPLSKAEQRTIDLIADYAENNEVAIDKPITDEMLAKGRAFQAQEDAITGQTDGMSFDELLYGLDTTTAKVAVTELSDDALDAGIGKVVSNEAFEAWLNAEGTNNEQKTDNERVETQAGRDDARGAPSANRENPQGNSAERDQQQPASVKPQENSQARPIVEAITKRRAAAAQIGKEKAFDTYLALAKKLMNGEAVKPTNFKLAAASFKADAKLAEAFNQLQAIAQAPEKEARAEKTNSIEAYKQRIADAKTIDALQTIAGEIQRDSALSDSQAATLDDAVFDAQDALDITNDDNAETTKDSDIKPSQTLSRDSSWVIRNKETGEVIRETFQKSVADKVNTDKYEAVPILQHLQEMNDETSKVRKYAQRDQPLSQPKTEESPEAAPVKADVQALENANDKPMDNQQKAALVAGRDYLQWKKIDWKGEDYWVKVFTSFNPYIEKPTGYFRDSLVWAIGKTNYTDADTGNPVSINEITGNALEKLPKGLTKQASDFYQEKQDELLNKANSNADVKSVETVLQGVEAAGWTRLDADDANNYVNSEGNKFRTYQKNGVRIALRPNHSLSTEKNSAIVYNDPDSGNVIIEAILVDEGVRKQGKATQTIKFLNELADKTSSTLYIEPVPLGDKPMDKDALVTFYTKNGFVAQSDANKVMVRKPNQAADLLGDNTAAKQAIADAERAKDAKRNTGTDNASDFNLSGSDSEADKAIASGAQALFSRSDSNNQTDTPAFKKWFADSKVVDADGKPLVVYHGTNKSFNEFSTPKVSSKLKSSLGLLGSFFTESKELASNFSKKNWSNQNSKFKDGANVIPSYLKIDNPYQMSVNEFVQLSNDSNDYVKQFKEQKQLLGHDGIIINPPEDGSFWKNSSVEDELPSAQYIAFEPNQIKSAIGNNGDFNTENNDIRFSNATTKGKLTVADVKTAIANDIYDQEVDVYASMADAPAYVQTQAKSEGASGVEGFFDKTTNRVALIANNLDSVERALEVARHELIGHYGMENMLGKEVFARITKGVTQGLNLGNKTYKELADYVLDSQSGLIINLDDSASAKTEKKNRLAREIIAVMAERGLHTNPKYINNSLIKQIIDRVRLFLKKLGFIKAEITDKELSILLRDAQSYLQRTGRSLTQAQGAMFSNTNQTNTPAFKNWFGDSKVVDSDGQPLVVYHGTRSDFNIFDVTREGQFGKGAYFTNLPGYASGFSSSPRYRESANSAGNVVPIYLKIKKPFSVDTVINVPSVSKLKKQGYDGIIYKSVGADSLEYIEYVAFEPHQIKSAIGNNGDFDGNNDDIRFSRQGSLTPQFDSLPASKIDNFIYTLQDKNIDLKRVTQNIKAAVGNITDRWNAYLQEELYHGRTAKRTQDFLKQELDPLIQSMQNMKVTMADFEEYLWMRHAPERNVQIAKVNPDMQDGGAGVTTAEAEAYMDSLTPELKAKYQKLVKRIDAINARSRQMLVDYGLESPATIAAWQGAYENYVPLMREEMDNGFGNGTGQGFSIKGNAAKRATGSKRAVVDILANIAQQREKYIIRGEKNRVSTALIGLATLNPNESFWKVNTVPNIKGIGADGLVFERPDPSYKTKDNVIVARIPNKLGEIIEQFVMFEQGDERAMRMAASLKNLDQDQIGEFLGTASAVTRYFASINTQYNPIFGLINIIRDVQGAILNLSSTALAGKQKEVMKHTLPALKGIYTDIRNARDGKSTGGYWAELFEEFQNEGGQTGYRDMFRNAKERGEAIEQALDPDYWQKSKLGKILTVNGSLAVPQQILLDKVGKPLFNWLSDYNSTLENAVRLSAYKVALDSGVSKQQAASLAKNLTVNFNRKGEIGRQVGALYAFFNASVQGTARLAKTLQGKTGKRIIYGGILLGVIQAIAMAEAGFDDEDPPEFVRDRNIIIPTGDGKFMSIPMPLGFNVLPAFGRIVTEFALSGFKKPAKRATHLIEVFMDMFNPIGNAGLSIQTLTPTALDPLSALAENKDFSGRNIARKDMNSLDPTPGFTRAKDTATGLSKALSYGFNYLSGGTEDTQGSFSPTPDQIDYLIGQVFGGVGREYQKIEQAATSAVTGEDLPSYKVPVLGRFIGDTNEAAGERNAFYNNIRKMNGFENRIKGMRERGEDAKAFIDETPETKLILQSKNVYSRINKLRDNKKRIMEQTGRNEDVEKIDATMTDLMKSFNERVQATEAL